MTAQPVGVLRIKVTIVGADHHTMPVPRHALLISDNPTSAAPQRAVTSLDGTAEVRLRPGNYTVESDQPLIFQGNAYEWRQTLDIAPGSHLLELTADNAAIEPPPPARQPWSRPARRTRPRSHQLAEQRLLDLSRRNGTRILIDARGLIATNQRFRRQGDVAGTQLSSTEKVAARVLATIPTETWRFSGSTKAVASMRPVTLGYADEGRRSGKTRSSPSSRRSTTRRP
jgi:hypothetical protein